MSAGAGVKHRVAAEVDGRLAELFSVTRTKKGDLLIAFRRNRFYERGDQMVPIREEKMSVHPSPNSSGRTITYTTGLGDGRASRHVSFVEAGKHPFLWLLFSRRYTDLSYEHFLLRRSPKEQVTTVARYASRAANLISHVFVGDPGAVLPASLNNQFPMVQLQFGDVELSIVSAYLNAASIPKGDVVSLLTSNAMLGDEVAIEVERKAGEPILPDDVLSGVLHYNGLLAERYRVRVRDNILGQVPLQFALPAIAFELRNSHLVTGVPLVQAP